MIIDLKRSIDRRWLLDLVLLSSLDDLVLSICIFCANFHNVSFSCFWQTGNWTYKLRAQVFLSAQFLIQTCVFCLWLKSLYFSSMCACICNAPSVFVFVMFWVCLQCSKLPLRAQRNPPSCPLQLFPSFSQALVLALFLYLHLFKIGTEKIVFCFYFSSVMIQTNSERHEL